MASGDIKITQEYRACMIDGKKALFHMWVKKLDFITNSNYMVGLVEFIDGTVEEIKAEKIRFCDGKIKEYSFEEG